ncbi:glycoside hydrolase family 15 and carbohydrate-binding module family 20 [Schizophyllum amplum]|uniref:Glucoamylase n=1 Tax=Schizophyllum amplum TaxID=97359 RepID=A0A550CWP3_9AGAR|nr:glycoside hydrolase family 15 and carbohydrate-binding module family 20 [Auriculariopsis ampla]
MPQFVGNLSAVFWDYKEQAASRLLCSNFSITHFANASSAMGLATVVHLALVGLCSFASAQSGTADAYVASESPIAKAGILANIGPSGALSQGAAAGVIIASPSTSDPDYLYTWTRDAALVSRLLVDQYTQGTDTSLQTVIEQYISAQATLQHVDNPSGSYTTGGLGEPKFNIDLSAFTGAWGRPQRDGPALRAITMITYGNYLLSSGNDSYVTDTLWPIVQADLDYVVSYWNQTGFDLWEEVSSSSFFTTAEQHEALRLGTTFATAIGETSSASSYDTQADNVLCFMQSYWNSGQGYMTANTGGGRSGIDANSVLTSIHTFDIEAGCDSVTFQPCSDRALSNLKVYVDSFRGLYSINSAGSTDPILTGRYKEDSYYNGNPWYLTTFAVAEQLYDALTTWDSIGSLDVTSPSLAFFQQFDSSIAAGTYEATSDEYTTLTTAIRTWADGFLEVLADFTPSDGGLAEQVDKSSGNPTSAADLTWSYASAITAFDARSGFVPASWGAAGLTVPATCSTGGGGGGGGGATVAVTFNVQATTAYGENIYVTGSVSQLANWSPDNAIALNADNYPTWSVTVNLPASTAIEYKYIRKNNGAVTWESDPNRSITTSGSGSVTQSDTWH